MSAVALLAPAPEVARGTAMRRRRPLPAALLVLLGIALIAVPIATGMFSKVAAGQQVLDRFQPQLEVSTLDQIHHELTVLEAGRSAAGAAIAAAHTDDGRFPGLTAWTGPTGDAINTRAGTLLASIRDAVPDYQAVRSIGGFDRIPFLVVAAGLALTYAGAVLLRGERRNSWPVLTLALTSAVLLAAFPFMNGLARNANAAERLLGRLQPIVTSAEVVQLQRDFVVVVTAEGEIDTSFRAVRASDAANLTALRTQWPQISADLANLVGDLNDSIPDVAALTSLDDLAAKGHGFTTLPWLFLVSGLTAGGLALAAQPRPMKERT